MSVICYSYLIWPSKIIYNFDTLKFTISKCHFEFDFNTRFSKKIKKKKTIHYSEFYFILLTLIISLNPSYSVEYGCNNYEGKQTIMYQRRKYLASI